MRRDTTGMLIESLGDARLHELRNEGQTFDTDRAITFTIDVLERAQRADSSTPTW